MHDTEHDDGGAEKYLVGPPPPTWLTSLTRVVEISTFVLTAVWVFGELGGLSTAPTTVDVQQDLNDTNKLFNWHPLLMSLAWPVFMAEAVLAYKVPLLPSMDRPKRKLLHAVLHSLALICIVGALIAVFNSHNMKLPQPIPNLYSPHSYLGIATFSLAAVQFLLGFYVFLFPKLSLRHRRAMSPIHMYVGRATFVAGLATMAVGLQEKTTFVQTAKKLAGDQLYSPVVKLPGVIQILLLATGLLVLYHHAPPPAGVENKRDGGPGLLGDARRSSGV